MPVPALDAGWRDALAELDRPNAARIDNALLGGGYNFAADRRAAAAMVAADPSLAHRMRASRAVVRGALRFALDRGIRQFVELGCGIPFPGGTHLVVHQRDPAAHVVYVDKDPVTVALIDQVLGHDPTVGSVEANPEHLDVVLGHDQTHRLIDFDQPVAVVLNRTSDRPQNLAGIVAALRETVAPTSALIVVPHPRTCRMRHADGCTRPQPPPPDGWFERSIPWWNDETVRSWAVRRRVLAGHSPNLEENDDGNT
ncbi:MAG: SAM-dependent methyltransferase [Micromonosporaceae bacterium]|nr:SAM-dependent methyltransferase [Micromonosporaceae bacterium]